MQTGECTLLSSGEIQLYHFIEESLETDLSINWTHVLVDLIVKKMFLTGNTITVNQAKCTQMLKT